MDLLVFTFSVLYLYQVMYTLFRLLTDKIKTKKELRDGLIPLKFIYDKYKKLE